MSFFGCGSFNNGAADSNYIYSLIYYKKFADKINDFIECYTHISQVNTLSQFTKWKLKREYCIQVMQWVKIQFTKDYIYILILFDNSWVDGTYNCTLNCLYTKFCIYIRLSCSLKFKRKAFEFTVLRPQMSHL